MRERTRGTREMIVKAIVTQRARPVLYDNSLRSFNGRDVTPKILQRFARAEAARASR